MAKVKLTGQRVEAMTAGAAIWDTDVKGFGARRRTAAGAPVFVLKYFLQGRQRFATIGQHGSPWTCESARREARRLLGEVASGKDVAGERGKAKGALTVAALAAEFFERHGPKLKPGTLYNYRNQLRLYVSPALGNLKAEAVRHGDVSKLHHVMRDKPYEANRTLAFVSKLFNWAEDQEYRPRASNPAKGVEKFRERRRERFLSEAELARLGATLAALERKAASPVEVGQLEAALAEVKRLLAARTRGRAKAQRNGSGVPVETLETLKAARAEVKRLRSLPADGESPWTVAAVRVLLLTGARRDEISKLKWEHVDLERGLLLLPDSKSGRKAIQLSAPAAAAIASVPKHLNNPYVFCGSKRGAPISDLTGRWERIRRKAGLEGVRLHDLRHTHASLAAGRGGSLVMIGALLGHVNPSTTQRYAHLSNDPLRDLNSRVGAEIERALGGMDDRAPAELKRFPR